MNVQTPALGRFRQHRARAGGFSLLELLIVIAIISVLSSMILPVAVSAKKEAHIVRRINAFRQIGVALQVFKNDHGRSPPGATWYGDSPYLWVFSHKGGLGELVPNYISESDAPKIFFDAQANYLTADNPDWGWANWGKKGLEVVSSTLYRPVLETRLGKIRATVMDFGHIWRPHTSEDEKTVIYHAHYNRRADNMLILYDDNHVSRFGLAPLATLDLEDAVRNPAGAKPGPLSFLTFRWFNWDKWRVADAIVDK